MPDVNEDILQKLAPSIVEIISDNGSSNLGTGFVVSDDGLIITSTHVIADSQDNLINSVKVRFHIDSKTDAEEFTASLVKEEDFNDVRSIGIAVLKLDNLPEKDVTPVKLDNKVASFNPHMSSGFKKAQVMQRGSNVIGDPHGCYYHIAVSSDLPEAKSSIEFDLKCEQDDKPPQKICDIIDKYNKFKEFDCEQRTFHPADVNQILVYKTNGNIEALQIKDPQNQGVIDESKRANKNSDKWNNIVLRHGQLMNESLKINKPNPSMADDYKLARKRSITNSIDTINDFTKTMITLVSGFFIAYFALIKFLGVQSVSGNTQMLLLVPPISFIISIIFLIVGLMPLYFEGYNNRTDTKNRTIESFGEDIRNTIRNRKYIPVIIGMGLFVLGLVFTIIGSFELFVQFPAIP